MTGEYLKDSIVGAIGKGSQLLGGYLSLFFLTSILSKEGYGGYVTGFTIASIAVIVAQMGFRQAVIQRVSTLAQSNSSDIKSYSTKISIIIAIFSTIIAGLVFLLSTALSDNIDATLANWLQLLSISIPALAIIPIYGGLLRGLGYVSEAILFEQVIVNLLRSIGLGAVWYFNGSAKGIAVAIAAAHYIPVLFLSLNSREWFTLSWTKFSRSHTIYAGQLFFNSLLSILLKRNDIIFMSLLSSLALTGGYSVAWKLAVIVQYSYEILTSTFQPRVSEYLSQGDIKSLKSEYQDVQMLSFTGGLSCCILIIALGDFFLNVFGQHPSQYPLLLFLSFGILLHPTFGPADDLLLMSAKGRLVLINTLIVLVVNISLNLLLIPQYGGFGAALTIISTTYLLSSVIFFLQIWYLWGEFFVDLRILFLSVFTIGFAYISLFYKLSAKSVILPVCTLMLIISLYLSRSALNRFYIETISPYIPYLN